MPIVIVIILFAAYGLYRILEAAEWVEYVIKDGRERPNE